MTSKLNPHAATVILSVPFRGEPRWRAVGNSRDEAEMYFDGAILSSDASIPAYRVVAQRKVDQYDHPSNNCTTH